MCVCVCVRERERERERKWNHPSLNEDRKGKKKVTAGQHAVMCHMSNHPPKSSDSPRLAQAKRV